MCIRGPIYLQYMQTWSLYMHIHAHTCTYKRIIAHTYTYLHIHTCATVVHSVCRFLHIVTYLHIVNTYWMSLWCRYAVGILFRYLHIWTPLFDIPTHSDWQVHWEKYCIHTDTDRFLHTHAHTCDTYSKKYLHDTYNIPAIHAHTYMANAQNTYMEP